MDDEIRTYVYWDMYENRNEEEVEQSEWESFEEWLETDDNILEWTIR